MSGLIAANGAFHRLRLPVLTLGSGPAADVTLDGLDPLHCIIAPTPAGPALRCFGDGAHVNGAQVAATMLKHGDVVVVGDHSFTMAWHGHNLETEVQRVLTELNEREADLNVRDADLQKQRGEFDAHCSAQLESRGAELEHDLVQERGLLVNQRLQLDRVRDALSKEHEAHEARLAELAQHRETFATERRAFAEQAQAVQAELERDREALAAAKIEVDLRLDDTREKHEAAKAVETRTRAAAAKYLLDHRATIGQERQQLRDLHLALSTQRGQIEQFEKSHNQEAAAANARIAASWSAISEGQAQAAQTRAAAEAEIARHVAALEARKAHLDEREAKIGISIRATETEIARQTATLEARKAHLDEREATFSVTSRANVEAEVARHVAALNARKAQLDEREATFSITSRANAEAEVARHVAALDARKAHLDEREATLGMSTRAASDKFAAMQAELANIEPRAAAARKVLADFEAKKMQAQAAPVQKVDEWAVPLTRDGRSADQLMFSLRQQEQEIGRERQRLAQQQHQAAAEREALAEQRNLVAEQVRAHEVARRQWKDAETQNLAEMEQMARMLTQREAELDARAKALHQPADQMSNLRATMESWQRPHEVKPPSVVSFSSMAVKV